LVFRVYVKLLGANQVNAKAIYATRYYLSKIENYIAIPKEIGWGKYLKNSQELRLAIKAYLFWVILQLLTILIPIFYE